MSDLITHLRSFNRKERFILLQQSLGPNTFRLGGSFRKRLGEVVGVTVPADAFVAMDYHLDWIQMALFLARTPDPPRPIPMEAVLGEGHKDFNENQMDVDLLVAFDEGATTHLVLVEAKMETGWTNKQLCSKAKRLSRIFGKGRPGIGLAKPCFVLASPNRPERLKSDDWPGWMKRGDKPVWLELQRPPDLRKVTRCTEEGRASASGSFLSIRAVTGS